MALSGVDPLTCSTLAAQLQASQMEELGGILSELERRFPKLAKRFVIALSGYGAEQSPVGLGVRDEWTELIRNGFAFAVGALRAAVAAQTTTLALVPLAGNPPRKLLRSVSLWADVATEVLVTAQALGASIAPSILNLLEQGSPPATTMDVWGGNNQAPNALVYMRLFVPANTLVRVPVDGFIFDGFTSGSWSFTTVAVNVNLRLNAMWAEPPATWPT